MAENWEILSKNLAREEVKKYPSPGRKCYGRLSDTGANLFSKPNFCLMTRLLFLLVRDCTQFNCCHATPLMLASELGTDVSNARKLLREIESLGFAIRVEDGAGSYYFVNPHCYCAGDVEEEKSSKKKWKTLWSLAGSESEFYDKSEITLASVPKSPPSGVRSSHAMQKLA